MANKNLFTKFASLAMAGALAFSGVPVTGLTGAFAAVNPDTIIVASLTGRVQNGNTTVSTGDDGGNGSAANPYVFNLDYNGGNEVDFKQFVTLTGGEIAWNTVGYAAAKKAYVLEAGSVTTGTKIGSYSMNVSTTDNTYTTGTNITVNINRLSLERENVTVLDNGGNPIDGPIEYPYDGKAHNPQEYIGGVEFDNVNTADTKVRVSTGAGDVYYDGTDATNVEYENDLPTTYTGKVIGNGATNKVEDGSSKEIKFRINPRQYNPADFDIDVDNVVENGGDPTVVVKDKTLASMINDDNEQKVYTLVEGTDYEVTFSGSDTAGSVKTAVINLKGNYAGTVTKQYEVVKDDKNLAGAEVTLTDSKNKKFNGTVQKNTVKSVTLNGKAVPTTGYRVEYTNDIDDDDQPKSAGVVTVKVIGIGEYAGEKTVTYTIDPLELKDSMVTAAGSTFDGTLKKPEVTVKALSSSVKVNLDDNGNTLEGTDTAASKNFVLNYQNNISAGTATAIVEGIGDYTGTASVEFAIKAKTIDASNFDSIPNQVYTGAAIEPAVTGKYVNGDGDEIDLIADEDFSVTYEKNIEVSNSNPKAKIKGEGNFTTGNGTISKSFAIKEATYDIANATVTLVADDAMYDGQNHVGSVKSVKMANAKGEVETLAKDTDYTVDAEIGKDVGEYKVEIKGAGKYAGTLVKTFAIKGYDVNEAGFKLKKSSVKYNGKNQKPELVVAEGTRFDGGNMTEGVDYEVSGIKNIKNVGKLTVKVTGLGGYAGTEKSFTFKVTKADQPMKVSTKTASVKASKVAKKNQTIKASKVFSVSKNEGSVSYKKESGNSKIKVASNGKITVKKGLKKGTYTIKVKVTAKGNSNYNSGNKTVKATIKVK